MTGHQESRDPDIMSQRSGVSMSSGGNSRGAVSNGDRTMKKLRETFTVLAVVGVFAYILAPTVTEIVRNKMFPRVKEKGLDGVPMTRDEIDWYNGDTPPWNGKPHLPNAGE
jgi:hypothetical protein